MENNNQNQEINETTTTGSVKVEVRIEATSTRSEASENGTLIPVSKNENNFTVNFELSSEKVKNIMKVIGEGVGDFVREKISEVGE